MDDGWGKSSNSGTHVGVGVGCAAHCASGTGRRGRGGAAAGFDRSVGLSSQRLGGGRVPPAVTGNGCGRGHTRSGVRGGGGRRGCGGAAAVVVAGGLSCHGLGGVGVTPAVTSNGWGRSYIVIITRSGLRDARRGGSCQSGSVGDDGGVVLCERCAPRSLLQIDDITAKRPRAVCVGTRGSQEARGTDNVDIYRTYHIREKLEVAFAHDDIKGEVAHTQHAREVVDHSQTPVPHLHHLGGVVRA
mmetsp:Transcript_21004/g.53233  ORF Transcript_21004/g.53233 Transcript_21004/m.53233 type:complete len:244 (-) Transcript_21004:31-762(-)